LRICARHGIPSNQWKPCSSKIQDCVDYAYAGGVTIGRAHEIRVADTNIFDKWRFTIACRKWNEKEAAYKTWANFKTHGQFHEKLSEFFFLQENPRPTTLGLRVSSKKDTGYNQNLYFYTPTTHFTHSPYIVTMLLYIRYQYSTIKTVLYRRDHTCNVPARAFNGPRHPLLGSIPLPISLLPLPFQHTGLTERYANTCHRNADAKPSHKFETLLQSDYTVQVIKIANPGFSR
jgi:hypothetical protein